MERHAFIPHDYRIGVTLGWLSVEDGFLPDEPLEVDLNAGILVRVKRSSLTPTAPPPRMPDPEGC